MTPLLVEGMLGLGDNIYQIPIIKELVKQRGPLFLKTPWPQLYAGMEGVNPVHCDTALRTQRKNVEKSMNLFSIPPAVSLPLRLSYTTYQRRGIAFYQALTMCASLPRFQYYLRLRDHCRQRRPYAVIRPVTCRTEWFAPARNCEPEYIQSAIRRTKFMTVRGQSGRIFTMNMVK